MAHENKNKIRKKIIFECVSYPLTILFIAHIVCDRMLVSTAKPNSFLIFEK